MEYREYREYREHQEIQSSLETKQNIILLAERPEVVYSVYSRVFPCIPVDGPTGLNRAKYGPTGLIILCY